MMKRSSGGDDDSPVKRVKTDTQVAKDWTEFIGNIKMEKSALNKVNAKLTSLVKSAMVAYDVKACTEMLTQMNRFTREMSAHKTGDDEGLALVNNITKETFLYPYNVGLKIKDLKRLFHETGHAFSVDMQRSYIVPLAFDFDCTACRQNACDGGVTASLAYTIAQEICTVLQTKLRVEPAGTDLNDQCVVFKARNTCNLHVYYNNLPVSIVLYHELVDLLLASLSPRLLDRYTVDKVSTLGLPFSAKSDAEPYTALTNLQSYEEFTVSPALPFYDIPVLLLRQRDLSVHKTIGTLHYYCAAAAKSDCSFGSWDDYDGTTTARLYLVVRLNYAVTRFDAINYNVQALKNNNSKFVAENNVNLEVYLNESVFDARHFCIQTSKIDACAAGGDPNVRREIKALSRKIAKFTYNTTDVSEESLYNYFVSFLVTDDCGYTFYALTAICAFIAGVLLSHEEHQDRRAIKAAIVDFVRTVLRHSQHFHEKKMLSHVLDAFARFDMLPSVESQIEPPGEWFAEISKQIKLKAMNGDIFALLTASMAVGGGDESARHNLLVQYFQVTCPLIKPVSERQGTYYFYHKTTGLYVECKESELMNKTTLSAKQLFKTGRQFLRTLVDSEYADLDDRASNDLLDSAWMTYISSAKSRKVKFNMYDFFICTDLGVFNTLTGTYMSDTPLLYFRTRKSYCTRPALQRLCHGTRALNLSLVDQYHGTRRLLSRVIAGQNALFYLAVAVPGLLLLEDTLYDDTLSADLVKCFGQRITCDTDEHNAAQMFYMMPVILRYAFDVAAVMRVCRLLRLTLERSGAVEIAHLKNTWESVGGETDPPVPTSQPQFDYTIVGTASNFIAEMRRVYGRAFSVKTYTICHFMCVFDHFSADPFLKTRLGVTRRAAAFMRLPAEYTDGGGSSPDSSFTLDPFRPGDFRTQSELNNRRAFSVLCGGGGGSEPLLDLLSTYSAIFEYDQRTLDDFFTFLSMIYYPANTRKFLMLLIGSPKCGKTTVQHLLRHSNEPSTFGTDTVFGAGGGGGPSPDLIQIFSTYLTNIIEVRRIDAETLKVLTGGDHVNKRGCHQNEFRELQPLSFAIGVANEMPSMSNADEAIRERLAIFMMSNRYVDASELNEAYEDNPLVLYAGHVTVKSRSFNVQEAAREFSNLLYAQYETKRNERGVVVPKMTNALSRRATEDFLVKNNYVYDILRKSNIVFHKDLQITINDMQHVVSHQIAKYNEDRANGGGGGGGKRLNWETFRRKVMVLFTNYRLFDNVTFRGFGLGSTLKSVEDEEENEGGGGRVFVRGTGTESVRLIDLKRYLQNVCKMSSTRLQETVAECRLKYCYDEAKQVFVGVRLVGSRG